MFVRCQVHGQGGGVRLRLMMGRAEVVLLVVFERLGIGIVPMSYVVSERDTMELNGMGYTRMEMMEDGVRHYKQKDTFW